MPFLVRLGTIGRSKDRYQWSPKDSQPSTLARLGNLSRNNTDPVRGQSYADSPPPYSQVQSLETTRTAAQCSDEQQRRPQRAATAPLTSGNLASFNERGQQRHHPAATVAAAAAAARAATQRTSI
jgi:hypothetical protein